MKNQGFVFEHKAHMSPWPPTIYCRGGLSLNCSFVRLPLLLESHQHVGRRYFEFCAAQHARKGEKRLFLTPSHPGESVCWPQPLRLLCLVSVATESERMQHPDARSGGIPLLTQGRGKRYIADGAQARCRICWESEDWPRTGRPQSSLLFMPEMCKMLPLLKMSQISFTLVSAPDSREAVVHD